MIDLVFVLGWTLALAGLAAPLIAWSQIRYGIWATPVIGLCIFGVLNTILYAGGVPLALTGDALGVIGLALSPTLAFIRRDAIDLTPFLIVALLALAPKSIGGEQFWVFQGNHYDQINYMAMSAAYGALDFATLTNLGPSLSSANDYNVFAAAMLVVRPTVAMVLAAMRPAFFDATASASYPYLVLLQVLTFFGFGFLLRAAGANRVISTIGALAFSIGTYVQLVFDINAWSHLAATSIACVAVGTAAFVLAAKKREAVAALALLAISATGLLYFYPEITPVVGLAILGMCAAEAVKSPAKAVSRFGLLVLVGAVVLGTGAFYWRGTIDTLLAQTGNAGSIPNSWFFYYSRYLVTQDVPLSVHGSKGDLSAILYAVFSIPVDFSLGALGAYFLSPPAGTPHGVAALWKIGAAAALIWLLWSIGQAVRQARGLGRILIFGALVSLLAPAAFFSVGQLWTGGKALLMIAPLLFLLICAPLFISPLQRRHKAISALLIICHIGFGIQRVLAANTPDGIFRPPPYPLIRDLKASHRWSVIERKSEFRSCRHVALDIADPHMSRYVQIALSELGVSWHSLRPLNSYYGQVQSQNLGTQPDQPYDCVASDQLSPSQVRRIDLSMHP